MVRGKKRSREPELYDQVHVHTSCAAITAGDEYFSGGTQKVRKAADNSALLNVASQHAAGYRQLLDAKEIRPCCQTDGLYSGRFKSWKLQLECKLNLLLYGYGCKRDLVSRFIQQHVNVEAVVMVHTQKKRISARQVIQAVAEALLPSQKFSKRASVDHLVADIRKCSKKVCVAIHNLDTPSLRGSTEQSALARLAACDNVWFIATILHPWSGLLHSFDDLDGFSFMSHHVPTFAPLLHDTLSAQPILAEQRCQEVAKSAADVLLVLTKSARAVFCTLVEALLGDLLNDEDEMTGISYEHLFRLCRERFLTSSDVALRGHLTEFKDHDLVKVKKGGDGSQLFYVPLPVSDLNKLMETYQAEYQAE